MKCLFVLAKENIELAQAEIQALLEGKASIRKNILLLDTKQKASRIEGRLAYTHSLHQVLFESTEKQFLKKLEAFPLDKYYKTSFRVRIHNSKAFSEKQLAKIVWNAVKKPKVDLKNAKTKIDVFKIGKKFYCTLLLEEPDRSFQERRSHLRPRPSPTSLHPKLARALVNLTGAQKGSVIVDPFCGSGGTLIEAGLMGLKASGSDLNKKMIWKSMVNTKHYKVRAKLEIKDFFTIKKKCNYIVTDLPYGLNADIMQNIRINKKNAKKQINAFYERVFRHLRKLLGKKGVIIVPHYIDYKKILKKNKFKLEKEFSQFVHNNLTRKMLVIS